MNWQRLAPLRTAVLVLVAFGLLAWAAFLLHFIAGLITTALLLLVLEIAANPETVKRA
jgi:hypothetical protein